MSIFDPEAFSVIARALPRMVEEGSDIESVGEAELISLVSADLGTHAQTESLVLLTRRILQSLALLDDEALSRGEWRMTSFSALLCARSLLSGLGDGGFRLLERGFWDAAEFRVDPQRTLLRKLEIRRRNTASECRPIRRVWVAWALMACDGRFLLVRREDSQHFREGSRGEFVLPGGRVSSTDLSECAPADRLAFFDPNRDPTSLSIAGLAVQRALFRELHEELDLDAGSLVDASKIQDLIRYTDLEGAASAHALTEYFIQLFRVELTQSGKVRLLNALASHHDRFAWFTAKELDHGRNKSFQTAFVDALQSEFGAEFSSVIDAKKFDLQIGTTTPLAKAFSLPLKPTDALQIGPTGQERSIHLNLSATEMGILSFLLAVRRGDAIESMAPGLSLVPELGWILVKDEQTWGKVRALCAAIDGAMPDSPLLSLEGQAVRVNVANANTAYFSPNQFSLEATDERRGTSYRLRLVRHAIDSALGLSPTVPYETHVSEKLGAAIYGLIHGDRRQALDDMDSVKRMQRAELREFLAKAGVRLLIRQVDGVPELYVFPPSTPLD